MVSPRTTQGTTEFPVPASPKKNPNREHEADNLLIFNSISSECLFSFLFISQLPHPVPWNGFNLIQDICLHGRTRSRVLKVISSLSRLGSLLVQYKWVFCGGGGVQYKQECKLTTKWNIDSLIKTGRY